MAAALTVIWWRDIPMQVIAKDRRQSHKIVLHPRFQVAVDRAAMKAGKRAASDYVEEMRRTSQACGDDLEAEANAEATRLEAAYTRERLAALVESGGIDPTPDGAAGGRAGTDAAGVPAAKEDA